MSMAEPRRRKKWSLNPRGTLWANDDTKFGQKLMEKMGWSKGNGLGREEQGMKEHLAVKFKDNSKGIGYKGSDDEWIKHYEEFENVLASLNSQENITINSKNDSGDDSTELPDHNIGKTSLESSSKASRVRVHYHKFTRGKDLSRCTEDDLGCILGSKRAKQLAKEKSVEDSMDCVDEVGHIDHSMGVTTIKGCSMQDYFAQKMEALRNRAKSQPQTLGEENVHGGEDKDVGRPGLEMSCGDGKTLDLSHYGEENRVARKKKKKRKNHQLQTEEICTAGTKSENCCLEAEEINTPKKKKKKRPERSQCHSINGNACEDSAMKTSNEDNAHYKPVSNEETKRKKSKKKHSSAPAEEQTLSAASEEHSVLKKKRKHTGVMNEDSHSQHLIVEENHVNKKKKKKSKAKA